MKFPLFWDVAVCHWVTHRHIPEERNPQLYRCEREITRIKAYKLCSYSLCNFLKLPVISFPLGSHTVSNTYSQVQIYMFSIDNSL
jgi:hypothetical protein